MSIEDIKVHIIIEPQQRLSHQNAYNVSSAKIMYFAVLNNNFSTENSTIYSY